MRSRARSHLSSMVLALAACALAVQKGNSQEMRARVVDEASRSGVSDATVTLLAADSTVLVRTTTGPEGFFRLSAPATGAYLIRVECLGYAMQTRSVDLGEGDAMIPAFVLQAETVQLDTLQVEARRGGVTPQGVVGFSRPSYLLAGERMATLERAGVSFPGAVRQLAAGLRIRDAKLGERSYTCIESHRHVASFMSDFTRLSASRTDPNKTDCQMVAIIIDGVETQMDDVAALRFVKGLHLYDYESIEYLSPVDAGTRYGLQASDRGALVLWTRGSGPHKNEARGGGG